MNGEEEGCEGGVLCVLGMSLPVSEGEEKSMIEHKNSSSAL